MATAIKHEWKFSARPKQIEPPGDWTTWLLKAGRGFGKTRTGVEWVHGRAMKKPRWCALVARTPADARDYLVEGPSGFRNIGHPAHRPKYEPSKRRLTWPNGSIATIYSDEEPDQTRGFSGDTALLDEFAKFKNPVQVWANLAFGMREESWSVEGMLWGDGDDAYDRPRRMITTTPRPLDILKEIESKKNAKGEPITVTVVGSSHENVKNLDPTWFSDIILEYEGTRTGRQEIYAEYVEELVGALFTNALIDRCRIKREDCPKFQCIVVSIDPSGAGEEDKKATDAGVPKNDEIGIVVAGLGTDNRVYLLEDLSCNGDPIELDGMIVHGPAKWGKIAAAAFHKWEADHVVAEVNFGGAMVTFVIKAADPNIPVVNVTASRGKHVRAEPVAALYDEKKDGIRHVGEFPKLEDQLRKFTTIGYQGSKSPDRADAWIWSVQDLALASGAHSWIEYLRVLAGNVATEEKKAQEKPNFGYAVSPKSGAGKIRLKVPAGTSSIYGIDGSMYTVGDDLIVLVTPDDAVALTRRPGFERVT